MKSVWLYMLYFILKVYENCTGLIFNRKYCGTKLPSPVISECSTMILNFHTDGNVVRTGFRAEYSVFKGNSFVY